MKKELATRFKYDNDTRVSEFRIPLDDMILGFNRYIEVIVTNLLDRHFTEVRIAILQM